MTLAAASQTVSGYVDSTGKTHPGSLMPIGQNVGTFTYGASCLPFINLVWGGQLVSNSSGASPDANGYIDATGGDWQWRLAIDWIPTESFILRWAGTCDITLRVGAQGSEVDIGAAGYPTVNRREYVFTDSGISGLTGVIDISGGTCTLIEFLFKDDETAYDAGQILNSTFLSDIAGSTILRPNNITNADSAVSKNFSEITDYNFIKWHDGFDLENDLGSNAPVTGIPYKANALMANDADADLWLCLPFMGDDNCISAVCQDVWDNLSAAWKAANHKIYVELGNEQWNSTFKNQWTWHTFGDVASVDATCVPATAVCTKVAHGLVTGDEIVMFDTTTHSDFPYSGGVENPGILVVRDDADNFRLTTRSSDYTISAATKANPCVVTIPGHDYVNGDIFHIDGETGMTELNALDFTAANISGDDIELSGVDSSAYVNVGNGTGTSYRIADDIIAQATTMRYKPTAGSVLGRDVNYATRVMECWVLAEAVFGAANMYKVMGFKANDEDVGERIVGTAGVREATDYYTTAPYMGFGKYETDPAGTGDISTATLQQLNDWIMDESGVIQGQAGHKTNQFNAHIANIGTYRMIAYEGGDHNGAPNSQWDTQAKRDRVVEWARSAEATAAYEWYFSWWADKMRLFVNFDSHREYYSTGTWGVMEHLGDTDAAEFAGLKVHLDAGGAHPL